MWSGIKYVFECPTLLIELAACRKLYTVTRENGEKMLTYINSVKPIAYALQAMEGNVNDKEIAMADLNGLPPNLRISTWI